MKASRCGNEEFAGWKGNLNQLAGRYIGTSTSAQPLTPVPSLLVAAAFGGATAPPAPSETVGERDLPFLISSLDGDRDFVALAFAKAARHLLPTLSRREFGMKLPHGLSYGLPDFGWFEFRVGLGRFAGQARKGVMHEPF